MISSVGASSRLARVASMRVRSRYSLLTVDLRCVLPHAGDVAKAFAQALEFGGGKVLVDQPAFFVAPAHDPGRTVVERPDSVLDHVRKRGLEYPGAGLL